MDRIIFIILILCIAISTGCNQASGQKERETPQHIIDEVQMLSHTPDSLLIADQLSKKVSILTILKETLNVDGNKFITTATPEDFEKKGLSRDYFDYYLKNIDEMNTVEFTEPEIQEMYMEFIKDLDNVLRRLILQKPSCLLNDD